MGPAVDTAGNCVWKSYRLSRLICASMGPAVDTAGNRGAIGFLAQGSRLQWGQRLIPLETFDGVILVDPSTKLQWGQRLIPLETSPQKYRRSHRTGGFNGASG